MEVYSSGEQQRESGVEPLDTLVIPTSGRVGGSLCDVNIMLITRFNDDQALF